MNIIMRLWKWLINPPFCRQHGVYFEEFYDFLECPVCRKEHKLRSRQLYDQQQRLKGGD